MAKYDFGVASYPKSFKETKISPTKICLQFNDVEIILRSLGLSLDNLPKDTSTNRYLPLTLRDTQVSVLAVGCQMPTIEALQLELIESYRYYLINHSNVYNKTYSKIFLNFLKEIDNKLDKLISDFDYEHK